MDVVPPLLDHSPPTWSLLIGSVGRFAVYAAVAVFALTAVAWWLAPRVRRLEPVGRWGFFAGCASVFVTFGCLAWLFVANRFEYAYVWGHADRSNAIYFRIAGIWSGQEGSFLLWAVCSAIMGLLIIGATGIYRRWYTIVYALFLGSLTAILAYESPFNLNMVDGKPFAPADGVGLAPSLQNYWVVIHPPTIFFGFGSLTALFALAVAALMVRNYEAWIPIVRPYAVVSMTLLGLGLCMGGFWAYETLGWGGFWMWDPVENVSFVPWCFLAGLVHGVIVQASRGKWQMANLFLAGTPFLLFVYGTFLTRSGLLSDASVHSFAEMDRSALKLLVGLMGVSLLGFFGLWGARLWQNRRQGPKAAEERGWGRESLYVIGVATLAMMGLAALIGMSVPLIMALRGQPPRVVPEGLYHQVMPWIFIPTMILMAITPFVAWKAMKLRDLLSRVYTVFCVTIGLVGLMVFLTVVTPARNRIDLSPEVTLFGSTKVNGLTWLVFLGGICCFVVVANGWRLSELMKANKMGTMPFLAHIGVAILMAGLIISRGFEEKGDSAIMQDHPARVLHYVIEYKGMTSTMEDRNNQLLLQVSDPHRGGEESFIARPGVYEVTMGDGSKSTMVWPHIERGPLMDTYIALGQPQQQTTEDFRLQVGESTTFGNMILTYKGMTRHGEFGQLGTIFGAKLAVADGETTRTIEPHLEISGEQGMIPHAVELAEGLTLSMVGMDAADKSVVLKVATAQAIYPIEVYHKPMTALVWLGTGILTLAGFGSALYRRMPRKSTAVVGRKGEVLPLKPEPVTASAIQGELT